MIIDRENENKWYLISYVCIGLALLILDIHIGAFFAFLVVAPLPKMISDATIWVLNLPVRYFPFPMAIGLGFIYAGVSSVCGDASFFELFNSPTCDNGISYSKDPLYLTGAILLMLPIILAMHRVLFRDMKP